MRVHSFRFFTLAAMASAGACVSADDRATETEDVTSGTPAFSEEQGWQYFPTVDPNNPVANKVAVAVRCTGSNCDNMSYLTCAVN